MNPENEVLDIANMIYFIRGQKVMIDSDLATLYGVETKILNQAIKRNRDRFPEDFMFELNQVELNGLRESSIQDRMGKLEQNSTKLFKNVFERLDSVEEVLIPRLHEKRKKIGLKNN